MKHNDNIKTIAKHSFFVIVLFLLMTCFTSCGKNEMGANEKTDSSSQNVAETKEIDSAMTPTPTPTPTPIPTPEPLEIPYEELPDGDFRKAHWGDTKEQVNKIESRNSGTENYEGEEKNILAYYGSLSGYDVSIAYKFDNDKLCSGFYILNEELINGTRYIIAYNSWADSLTKKYGEKSPESKGKMYQVDKSQADYAGDNLALELGYISFLDCWETDNTKISLFMFTDDDFITKMTIVYEDKTHDDTEEDSMEGF